MHFSAWKKSNFGGSDWGLVTGTTSGIGKEYAEALAKLGCNLICVSNESGPLEVQKSELESKHGIRVRTLELDLRDIEETKAVAASLANEPIKVLINNAGFGLKGPLQTHPVQDYIDVINVNAVAPVVFTRALLPGMQKSGSGFVIHVASINAVVPIPNNQVYTATKAFCFSYAAAVARENKNSGIRFQLVLPSTTRTPFHDRQGAHPGRGAMLPETVVEASLRDVNQHFCIPHRGDRFLASIFPFLPRVFAIDLAGYILKKRLGV
ncbi:MAG: SDR family NAD(P)-dependent oxidoreductase [Bdellovibrionaceae bacterium]|nr:SDR family NAD(P)-dependent oxidoreductase [Pseudobdellovibrionaceae bacterium]